MRFQFEIERAPSLLRGQQLVSASEVFVPVFRAGLILHTFELLDGLQQPFAIREPRSPQTVQQLQRWQFHTVKFRAANRERIESRSPDATTKSQDGLDGRVQRAGTNGNERRQRAIRAERTLCNGTEVGLVITVSVSSAATGQSD